eukprot:Gregarina_sp_Poly_1__1305@NODE_131_length_13241_cov_228_075983_g117_i0_p7_GENE_NODE_131_length_13241_cov_228_075983_g117_i0NODE_131_length_13241_cov_228_075983_g117_i0_p7_ORF_typecomplete_len113_score8_26_NODE_131_length_13241_cov_228_075983_g117_i066927030
MAWLGSAWQPISASINRPQAVESWLMRRRCAQVNDSASASSSQSLQASHASNQREILAVELPDVRSRKKASDEQYDGGNDFVVNKCNPEYRKYSIRIDTETTIAKNGGKADS